ncbi:hypothetical protein L1D55_26655 [Vibrio sp. Isolate22]|nr:hypothetical protein [Vibrio sp. Isolate22]
MALYLNLITQQSPMIDINGDLDPSLRDAPIDPLTYQNIEDSQIKTIDENTIEMEVTYVDGTS